MRNYNYKEKSNYKREHINKLCNLLCNKNNNNFIIYNKIIPKKCKT